MHGKCHCCLVRCWRSNEVVDDDDDCDCDGDLGNCDSGDDGPFDINDSRNDVGCNDDASINIDDDDDDELDDDIDHIDNYSSDKGAE